MIRTSSLFTGRCGDRDVLRLLLASRLGHGPSLRGLLLQRVLLRGHLLPRHLAALRGLEFGRGLGQLRVVPGRLRVVAGGLRSLVSISQVPQIHAMNFRFSDETCTYMCVALCGERMYY